jgi:hypothetical protein
MTTTAVKYCDVPALKRDKQTIFYKDWIQSGLSVKVKYLTNLDEAIETYQKLRRKYPHNVVRLLTPSPIYRKNKYSVRIWV